MKQAALTPASPETEQAVLAAGLMDATALDLILDQLDVEDFHDPRNRVLYDAAKDMRAELATVDLTSLRAELQRLNRLEAAGGIAYIANMVDQLADLSEVDTYVAALRQFRLAREINEVCTRAAAAAYDGKKPEDVLATLNRRLRALEGRHLAEGPVIFRRAMEEATAELAERRAGKKAGLLTGFDDLDSYLSGLDPGQLVIVAARPGLGKTALAAGFIRHVAIRDNHNTVVFSLEMRRAELVLRTLSSESGVDHGRLRSGTASPAEQRRIEHHAKDLADAPLWIDDSRGIGLSHIQARLRRLDRDKRIKLVVVDYLGLVQDESGYDSEHLRLGSISNGLKTLAGQMKVPVVALHQLNRSSVKDKRRPALSDLDGSGRLEQDADTVLMLHQDSDHPTITEVHIVKQRSGPTGMCRLRWTPNIVRFDNEFEREEGPTLWPQT